MTGRLERKRIGPCHLIQCISPRCSTVSPMIKCATTVSTRYPKANKATIEVYFNESSRRRKDNGIMTSLATVSLENHTWSYMKAVIQNCRSKRNGIDFADGKILPTTWGIKSPIIIKYDTATPRTVLAKKRQSQRRSLPRGMFSLLLRKTMNARVLCGGRNERGSRGRFLRCSLRR
jgi:hypothetical protein